MTRRLATLAGLVALATCAPPPTPARTPLRAPAPARPAPAFPAAPDTDRVVDSLLARMTAEEKVGQLTQLSASDVPADSLARLVRQGRVGSLMEVIGADSARALQRLAVAESRLHVPLLFADDVVHGFRTIFPIPLAEAASWDTALARSTARVAATEGAAAGLHWTYAPMVDVARDPRWGRVMEGAGEDPALGAAFAAARVRGFQGRDLRDAGALAATAKHFAGYGSAEGGRDYAGGDLSERALRDVYLPPFHAALCAGAATIMAGFNEIAGVPSHANRWLLGDVLRGEWRFDGVVVSDWNGVVELIPHGVAADRAAAATLALGAGVDVDMVSRVYADALPALVRSGAVPERAVDDAARHVLRLKRRLGLFADPDHGASAARERAVTLTAASRALARQAAGESIVLLENRDGVLPLRRDLPALAVIGALAADSLAPLGSWSDRAGAGAVTVLAGIRAALPPATRVTYARGASPASDDTAGIAGAARLARQAGRAVLVLGETREMTGEASSRASLALPGAQMRLVEAVAATGVPTVAVLLNGRPLDLSRLRARVPAIVEAWFGGTEAGNAIADVLFGARDPGGALPMTFPGVAAYRFGHGLSYTTFAVGAPRLGATVLRPGDSLVVEAAVTNTGGVAGDGVVQLYLRDEVASVVRPARELRGFRRLRLAPGESRTVRFVLRPEALALHDAAMRRVAEPGWFAVTVDDGTTAGASARFRFETPDGEPLPLPERCEPSETR